MKSFIDLDRTFSGQPPRLGVLLGRVDVARGQEKLFQDQLPELLTALSRSARVESIHASNAIEGIDVPTARAENIAAGGMRFRNRGEREFAGYRDAIDEIVRRPPEPISVPLLLHLHRQLLRHVDGRGGSFKSDQNLIVSYEGGRRKIVFTPPDEIQTPFLTKELVDRYLEAQDRETAHPLALLGAFILDLLAIHPVADGNGRVARLATNSEMLRLGYGVPRYVSLEQQIFESKSSYYASLAESQRGWHEGTHTIWPWVQYLAGAVAQAYDVFERRTAAARGGAGRSKQDRVRAYVLEQAKPEFRLADIRRAVPGVSDETIRIVLNALKADGKVRVRGRGPGARWLRA